MDVDVELRDTTEEIDVLNSRYRRALKDKVSVYDELVKAVKQLTDRNSTFMRNEIEICRLTNLSSITKKELEQKEKMAQELEDKINEHEKGKKLRSAADVQIKQKHEKIQNLSNDLFEKDKMIEDLEGLPRKKEAQQQEMQMQLEEQGRPSDEVDNTHKKFTEQVIKSASKNVEKTPVKPNAQVLRQQRDLKVPKNTYQL